MGNRRLDRILPEEYRQQWHNLDVAAEERKAYLKAHPPQPRPKPVPVQRELHSVFMSEGNRRLVEDLLKGDENEYTSSENLHFHSGANHRENTLDRFEDISAVVDDWSELSISGPSVRVTQSTRSAGHKPNLRGDVQKGGLDFREHSKLGGNNTLRESNRTTASQAIRRKLLSMGFKTNYINMALAEREELSSVLDWLILNVPEHELPSRFAPESSKASVQVLVRGKQAVEDPSATTACLSHLQEYGYPYMDCITALSEACGDEDVALSRLFESTFHPGSVLVTESTTQLADTIAEELIALDSIFGDESCFISESLSSFYLPVREEVEASLEMEVRIPSGSRYPFEVPVIALRSSELPAELLLALTKQLVENAERLLGNSMIFELQHKAIELAQGITAEVIRSASYFQSEVGLDIPKYKVEQYLDEKGLSNNGSSQSTGLSPPNGSATHGSDSPVSATYVPPALRRLSPTTLSEVKGQPEGNVATGQSHRQDSGRSKENSGRSNEDCAAAEFSRECLKLKNEWEHLRRGGRNEMWAARSKLPAFKQRDDLLRQINAHNVTVVAGQTGCGKSTQVPQYVLEDYIERDTGAACNIICTQPRRLSAIGLADRVAKERGQGVGETVGYSVRLESCRSHRTRLLFCTTGILLRRLSSDRDLENVTHVIVDEVHERTLESDLLLLLLRELLKRVGGRLRVILMSATVDPTLFVRYFRDGNDADPCIVSIPGFTYPVQELYLEDALDLTGFKIGRNSRYAMKKKSSTSDLSSLTASAERSSAVNEDMDNWESLAEDNCREEVIPLDEYSEATMQSLSIVDQSLINYDLIELIICAILQRVEPFNASGGPEGQAGAILVFLPGVAEIRRLQRFLQQSSQVASCGGGNLWILALHGSLSSDEQRRVFSRPAHGTRKVVLATNIAETSVTIDDCVYVIDTGRHKEMRYDHSRGISCLEETWVSKASAKQRRGRAGRVQSGFCVRLYSRQQFQKLEEHQLPEILRVSLDGLCLKVKSLLDEKVEVSVSRIITSPDPSAVRTSLKNLLDLNALDAGENLTPLGHHLVRMPVDARVGKMLLFGCMLKCLDPVLTIAAALSGRSPFMAPPDKREEAAAAKLRLAGGSKSDHLTVVAAYNGWLGARQEGRGSESNFCAAHFLSRETLAGIEASRQDFVKILTDIGFLSSGLAGNHPVAGGPLDSNSGVVRVVKAVICAGFYPNIVRVHHPEKTFVQTEGGTVERTAAARELRFFTKADGRVFLHPASVNFHVGAFESPWLVFSEKVRTSKVFLKESTMVPAYGLLLFGGRVQVKHEKQAISVDDWLEFEAPARIAVLIKELRTKVDSLLFDKIKKPALDIGSSPVVSALIRLLTTDGF
ncbi:ATP-dependent RNA helicase DHX57 [Marchantia polymorpha subsp. ruderalis]